MTIKVIIEAHLCIQDAVVISISFFDLLPPHNSVIARCFALSHFNEKLHKTELVTLHTLTHARIM